MKKITVKKSKIDQIWKSLKQNFWKKMMIKMVKMMKCIRIYRLQSWRSEKFQSGINLIFREAFIIEFSIICNLSSFNYGI